eukprot:scaffold114890_cov63-Phaeocystis_antarctica.AAC.1
MSQRRNSVALRPSDRVCDRVATERPSLRRKRPTDARAVTRHLRTAEHAGAYHRHPVINASVRRPTAARA